MLKLAQYISKSLAILVLVVALIALLMPSSFAWLSPSNITWMLGVIMCGMGLNLRLDDFRVVFSRPKDILVGCAAQFTIMPLLAWVLCRVFHLPTELAVGVLLVGCCPGGTSSNVITYLAGGDLALSVGMTGVSTLLAPIMTPALVYALAGESVNVDCWGMFLSIVEVVIVPILIGLMVRKYAPKVADAVTPYMPAVSTITIALIVGCIMSANAERVLASSVIIMVVVALHNMCGYALGYGLATLLKLNNAKRTAITVEVGMQNSGLATSLAAARFAIYPMATIPGALFSVWHNFSGALIARLFQHLNRKS